MKKIILPVLAFALAGCGGGGGDAPPQQPIYYYGSLAVNQSTGQAYILVNNRVSAQDAKVSALVSCGFYCVTALEFGNGMCGALSKGTSPTGLLALGWASASTKSAAEAEAISQCTKNNGTNCDVSLSMCNG